MTTTAETEVKELRDLITEFREEVRIGIISTKAEVQRVEIQLSSDIKAVDQKIVALDQRVTALDDRLKTQDGKIWTLVTILLGSAIILLIKILGFPST
jgi:chromosome segregation ATPase